MNTEYEATFTNINKDAIREKLKATCAVLVYGEFLQKRVSINPPKGIYTGTNWLRVRQEFDKVTVAYKDISGDGIERQKEIEVVVDDFDQAVLLLEKLGCVKKAYQENRREKWQIGNIEIVIDEWPFLEPFVEIEGPSEVEVQKVSAMLGFDWSSAVFDSITYLYTQKYGITADQVNSHTPLIVFGMENPFIDHSIKN